MSEYAEPTTSHPARSAELTGILFGGGSRQTPAPMVCPIDGPIPAALSPAEWQPASEGEPMTATNPATWWRLASLPARPADERVRVSESEMTSPATCHHADYVGDGQWHVDYLQRGPVSKAQAKHAIQIAAAVHDHPSVDASQLNEVWLRSLGMTAREAVGYALMDLATHPDIDWRMDRG